MDLEFNNDVGYLPVNYDANIASRSYMHKQLR